jgi:epoxyqueuosine reductase
MTVMERNRWVVERARGLGFDLCGVAPAEDFEELARLPEWLEKGFGGEMHYLEDPRRQSPGRVLEGARSLIVCALNYNTKCPYSTEAAARSGSEDAPRGWISRYAWGDDYHVVLGGKLRELLAALREEFVQPFEARAYVDTGPLVERLAARYAGLGWLAKNTCLIHPQLGSWLFLGVIVTTLDLAPTLGTGEGPSPDLCGNCTLCIDACPTDALVEPYVLDARRCISYLTIEYRGVIPVEMREAMGRHIFGCDICQDVCPWNGKARVGALAGFAPREGLFAPELERLAAMTQEEYSAKFRKSAVRRAKWSGLVRNACVALGNAAGHVPPAARERVRVLLRRLACSEVAVIAEHAGWALEKIEKDASGRYPAAS